MLVWTKKEIAMRRRRRASWEYAGNDVTNILDNGTPGDPAFRLIWLFPPGRTNYLCETRGKDAITHSTTLLWLDFQWNGEAEGFSGPQLIAPTYFYILKTKQDANDNTAEQFSPYATPPVPSAVTDWTSGLDEDDGTEPFLWTHYIDPLQAGTASPIYANAALSDLWSAGGNADQYIANGRIAYPNTVRQAWQPDVVVKAKRRMAKTEGIALVFGYTYGNTLVNYQLTSHWRTLVS